MSLVFHNQHFNIGDKVSRNILLNTDQGLMIVNRFDSNHENVGHGQWLLDHGNCNTVEVNDCYQAIRHKVNPNILDVGANIGTISIWLSRIFTKGRIYSFEAQRQVFYQLAGNVALNNLYNIDVFNYAVSSQEGFISVKEPNYFSNHDFGTFSLVETKITQSINNLVVPTISLDTFVEKYKIDSVDLIKIDVEGMDLDVLKGSLNIIERDSPVIYVEHFDNKKSILTELKTFLNQFDYQFDIRGNNLLCQK
ncbi:FkbM family methyltransferase [bacterium]|nr:FkbM family methyltransferase [bacterium]